MKVFEKKHQQKFYYSTMRLQVVIQLRFSTESEV